MHDWMPGWPTRPAGDGGSMIGGAEWSLVLHTTEGSTFEGATSSLDRGAWPHYLMCPRTRRKLQAVPQSRAGRSLTNRAGGVETNRENTIQVEIVGFAAESQDWPDDWYEWLGTELGPVLDDVGIGRYGPTFVGQEAGWIARADAPQRFSFDAWRAFGGVCGHQHVPENDHWDPGAFRLDKFLAAAGGASPWEDDDMLSPEARQAVHDEVADAICDLYGIGDKGGNPFVRAEAFRAQRQQELSLTRKIARKLDIDTSA
jgi:hypothetical protein